MQEERESAPLRVANYPGLRTLKSIGQKYNGQALHKPFAQSTSLARDDHYWVHRDHLCGAHTGV